jgi:glycine cleavage system aminomethyltransferase T
MITSMVFSLRFQKTLAYAMVAIDYATPGTELQLRIDDQTWVKAEVKPTKWSN